MLTNEQQALLTGFVGVHINVYLHWSINSRSKCHFVCSQHVLINDTIAYCITMGAYCVERVPSAELAALGRNELQYSHPVSSNTYIYTIASCNFDSLR